MYGASVRRRLYPLLQLVVRPHRARHFGTQTYAIQLAYPGSTSSTGGCRIAIVSPNDNAVSSTQGTLLPPNWVQPFPEHRQCVHCQSVLRATRPVPRRRPFPFCPCESCTVPTEHRGGAILWKQATDLAPFPDPWSVLLRGDRRTRDGPYFLRRTKD